MQTTKVYKLFKTAKKTAKENNLIYQKDWSNKNILIDLELLSSIDLEVYEKEHIFNNLKDVCISNNKLFYGNTYTDFKIFQGYAEFCIRKVYDKSTGKRLYAILYLARLEHTRGIRSSIYDSFTTTTEKTMTDYCQTIKDIEI